MSEYKILDLNLKDILPIGTAMKRFHVDEQADHFEEAKEYLEEAYAVGKPLGVYKESYVESVQAEEVVIDGITFHGPLICEKLEDVHRVFPYAATCGKELDELASSQTDPLMSYYANDFNQHAAGLMAGRILSEVKKYTGIEKMVSINPGSLPDWPVTEQKGLFSLLGSAAGEIGMILTESCLMLPVKSVSGMLFASAEEWFNCMRCPRPDCPGRRAPFKG